MELNIVSKFRKNASLNFNTPPPPSPSAKSKQQKKPNSKPQTPKTRHKTN